METGRSRSRKTLILKMNYKPLKTLSIAAPAYNEAERISDIVESWYQYLKRDQNLAAFEIVICNDGSKDDTGKILGEFSSRYPEVKVTEHKRNKGAAAALSTAIQNTSYDWVLLLDSDGQFPIENLENFRKAMVNSPAFSFIGVRPSKQDSLFARFGSWSSGFVCNLFLGTHYRDFNSACKLVDGRVLRWLRLEAKGLNYSTDITAKLVEAGFAPAEVNIRHKKRVGGKSSRALIRGSFNRFLFVSYLICRQLLFLFKILQRPSDLENRPYGKK